VELIDNSIPNGVKLVSRVVVGQREVIATAVTSGVVRINSRHAVKRLVDITQIVDQET
jgi:hypothetical protein